MITISTTAVNANHLQKNTENLISQLFEESEDAFYENMKYELDALMRDPQQETIEKILAYSLKSKI